MRLTRSNVILLLILLIGLFLRIYHLGHESIWVDEAYSIRCAGLCLPELFEEIAGKDKHPPLYYVILHTWVGLFGDSEFSARLPSAIFGFLCLLMMYKVGSLMFDREVGLLSCMVLALSLFHVRYSQEARMYSLMALLFLVSIYYFIRLLEEGSIVSLLGYILSTSLLMHTHYYGLFMVAAQNVYVVTLFLFSKGIPHFSLKKWVWLQVVLALLFAPWAAVLVGQFLSQQQAFWIARPSANWIISCFRAYSGGSRVLLLVFLMVSPFSVLTYRRLCGKAEWHNLFGSLEAHQWNVRLSNLRGVLLLAMWLLTPIILPYVASQFLTPFFLTRYTIGASLAFYFLAAMGIASFKNRYVRLSAVLVVVACSLASMGSYYTKGTNTNWRDAINDVERDAEQGDLCLIKAVWYNGVVLLTEYYGEKADLVKKQFPVGREDGSEEQLREELLTTVKGHDRVWVIVSKPHRYAALVAFVKSWMLESYHLCSEREYFGVATFLFEKNSAR